MPTSGIDGALGRSLITRQMETRVVRLPGTSLPAARAEAAKAFRNPSGQAGCSVEAWNGNKTRCSFRLIVQ
jgi:hypothetical protein